MRASLHTVAPPTSRPSSAGRGWLVIGSATAPDAARSVPPARPVSGNVRPPVRQGRGAPTLPDQRSKFMQACRKDTNDCQTPNKTARLLQPLVFITRLHCHRLAQSPATSDHKPQGHRRANAGRFVPRSMGHRQGQVRDGLRQDGGRLLASVGQVLDALDVS